VLSRLLVVAAAGLTLSALAACASEPRHIPHPTAPAPSRVIPPPPPIDVLRPH
jgi:hypothetical protein